MYRYFVNKRAPMAHWQLDGTVPFTDYTGFNVSGGKKSGTADPTKSVPLVAGASYSSVFKSSAIGQFSCPVFKQGLESRPFALESWVLPTQRTSGYTSQTYRENLLTMPRPTNLTTWGFGGPTATSSIQTLNGLGNYVRVLCSGAFTGTAAIYCGAANATRLPVTAGKKYSFSIFGMYTIASGFATLTGNCRVAWFDASNVLVGGAVSGPNVNVPNAKWSYMTAENLTAPAGAVSVRVDAFFASATYASGDIVAATKAMAVEGATVGSYFDGSMPGCEWTGAVDASSSRTKSNISFMNLAPNPRLSSASTGWAVTGAAGTSGNTNTFETTGGPPENPYWYKTVLSMAPTASPFSHGMLQSANNSIIPVLPGQVYSFAARAFASVPNGGGTRIDVTWLDSAYATVSAPTGTQTALAANTWEWRYFLNQTAPSNALFARVQVAFSGPTNLVAGNVLGTASIMAVQGSTINTPIAYFNGNDPGATWNGTADQSTSLMLVSSSDQQILSHGSVFDGLSINGSVVRFGTSYLTSGDAFCSYDLGVLQKAHVVGIHNADQNQLWVNGSLVSSVVITDAQKADKYIAAADSNLYSGYTLGSSEVAMNGVAYYASLSGEQINQNYSAGNNVLPQLRVAPQYSGSPFPMDAGKGTVFIDKTWANSGDFADGVKYNVEIGTEQINPSFVSGVSVPGTWTCGVPLDAMGDTSIYGVLLSWSGYNVTVDVSLDGITWTRAKNNDLVTIVPNGYNPTGKDLQARVNFAGGLADDTSYLESLRIIGFRDNAVNVLAARTVTVTYPAALRQDFGPFLYRDDNGIDLGGGTLTIGTDTTVDPEVARTLELWIKPLSGTTTISFTGTKYRNGAADSTLPTGEWSLVHIVAGADVTTPITITGDCIIGQATLYPTALTANDVSFLFKSYTGAAVTRFTENQNTLVISEGATPVSIYAKDWAIDGAG